jgi:hypothetical protein
MKLFAAFLLRGYSWELPQQDLSLDASEGIPIPKDRLQVRFQRSENSTIRAAGHQGDT